MSVSDHLGEDCSPEKEYAFDVMIAGVIRVREYSKERALALIRTKFDAVSLKDCQRLYDEGIKLTELSVSDGPDVLFEIDGKEVGEEQNRGKEGQAQEG